jgi:hypothetical protein
VQAAVRLSWRCAGIWMRQARGVWPLIRLARVSLSGLAGMLCARACVAAAASSALPARRGTLSPGLQALEPLGVPV